MLTNMLAWALLMTPGFSPASRLVGRWDLTFQSGEATYPGWVEIVASGDSFRGRLQGRFGHATALAGIRSEGDAFHFLWPDEAAPTAKPTAFTGTIGADDRLSGTMTAPSGERTPFTGERAPLLPAPAEVEWGEPIDLLAAGLDGWRVRDPAGTNGWSLAGGVLVNTPPSVDLVSHQVFADFRLHLEVNVPPGGNSGIYLRGRHEVQVQDDHGKEPHSRRMGGIYGQVTPSSLPAKPAGEWQSVDVTLLGRWVTVVLNGVTIIDRREIPGITGGALESQEGQPGPLMLQGDHTGVRYRNIIATPARGGR
jgi:hypothetical protein